MSGARRYGARRSTWRRITTVRSPPSPKELRALVERLNARLFDRVQAERNPDRRALIAMFPGQVASLEPVLLEFLHAGVRRHRDGPAPLLRGVYFTSGTQEGTPIDRLTGTLARSLGVDMATDTEPSAGTGAQLFPRTAAEGRDLRRGPAGRARSRRGSTPAGVAAAGLRPSPPCWSLVTAGMLWQLRSAGQREIDALAAALGGYEQTARSLPLDPVADDDLVRLAPLLDQAARCRMAPRRTVLAAGCTVAARQARCLGARGLSPCAGMGAAAAADVAAGDRSCAAISTAPTSSTRRRASI